MSIISHTCDHTFVLSWITEDNVTYSSLTGSNLKKIPFLLNIHVFDLSFFLPLTNGDNLRDNITEHKNIHFNKLGALVTLMDNTEKFNFHGNNAHIWYQRNPRNINGIFTEVEFPYLLYFSLILLMSKNNVKEHKNINFINLIP